MGDLDFSHVALGSVRVQETEEFVVEVVPMMFNWRLVVYYPWEAGRTYEHGYCYFGTGPATRARAVAAGEGWVDPLHTHPAGYDKQAF